MVLDLTSRHYRAEWQRFAETLGRPDDRAAQLAPRIVKAVAELTGSPAGLMLLADGAGLRAGVGWNWEGAAGEGDDESIARHLAATHRIQREATSAVAVDIPAEALA